MFIIIGWSRLLTVGPGRVKRMARLLGASVPVTVLAIALLLSLEMCIIAIGILVALVSDVDSDFTN